MQSDQKMLLLDWDSAFFGRKIARVIGNRLTADDLAGVVASCKEQEIDCLYFLADSEDAGTIRASEQHGFNLADIRVTLERQVADSSVKSSDASPDVRMANLADIPVLRPMAAVNHRDSRFYQDGGFDRERCDELYATWIEKSCKGYADAVLVADCGTGAVGYISCHLRNDGVGQIGLVGVSGTCQGKGIGKQLLNESLRWFAAAGVSRIEVVTQGRNVTAQRLYQKSGFLTGSLQIWYHRWFL